MTLTELQSLRKDFNTLTTIELIMQDVWIDVLEDDIEQVNTLLEKMVDKLYQKINKQELIITNNLQ